MLHGWFQNFRPECKLVLAALSLTSRCMLPRSWLQAYMMQMTLRSKLAAINQFVDLTGYCLRRGFGHSQLCRSVLVTTSLKDKDDCDRATMQLLLFIVKVIGTDVTVAP